MSEVTEETDLKKELQAFKIILYSMMAGITLFLLTSLIAKNYIDPIILDKQKSSNLFVIFLSSIVIALAVVRYYFNKRIKIIGASAETINQKFTHYKKALLIFYAVAELIALLGIIAFLLLNEQFFLIVPAAVLFEMFMKMPTESKMNSYIFNTSHFNL